jgi:hypothetical protein
VLVWSREQRRKEWKTIEKYLALQMPGLTFSNGVEACLSLTGFVVAVAVVIFILPKLYGPNPLGLYVGTGSWIGSVLLTGFGALILWAITRAKLQPLATRFPAHCESAGDLVKLIVAKNYGATAKRAGGWKKKFGTLYVTSSLTRSHLTRTR